jgi:hypothetical protein
LVSELKVMFCLPTNISFQLDHAEIVCFLINLNFFCRYYLYLVSITLSEMKTNSSEFEIQIQIQIISVVVYFFPKEYS